MECIWVVEYGVLSSLFLCWDPIQTISLHDAIDADAIIFNFWLKKAYGEDSGSSGGKENGGDLDRRMALKVSLLETILPPFFLCHVLC